MKRFLLAVVTAMLITPAVGGAHAPSSPLASASKTCTSSYTTASIGGATKCLRRGEYCAKAYKSTYRRYGFSCSGDPARLH